MKLNWDHLRYFNTLAQRGTLSATARQLGVSHSTVQRHIAALEDELNVKLFNHKTTGYSLTNAGEQLHTETAGMQRVLGAISSRIAGNDNELEGTVTITVTDTVGHFLLPDIVRHAQRQFPQINLALKIENQQSNIQDFAADIAVRTGVDPPPVLIGRKVGELQFALCASRHYLEANNLKPVDTIELAEHFVTLDASFSGASFCGWSPRQKTYQRITSINGFLGAYRLCKAGAGIALLPEYLTRFDNDLIVIPCATLPPRNEIWVLSPAELRSASRVRVIRQLLYEQLQTVFKERASADQ